MHETALEVDPELGHGSFSRTETRENAVDDLDAPGRVAVLYQAPDGR
jgi:hypothetical protein